MSDAIAIALHGGAGPLRGHSFEAEQAHLKGLAEEARDQLRAGGSAVDVVVAAVKALEASGLYIAGKGSSANAAGEWELDASLMDGASRKAGAVAALQGFASPIEAARAVMDETPHVMLAGAGAAAFARAQGLETVDDPSAYYVAASKRPPPAPGELAHGTVGAVARDKAGRLAAATSTGGVIGKMPGRIGDSPLIGAGTWADERVAISCTGQGEYFIRAAVAADISARMAYAGMSVDAAAAGALADMARQGGDGGLIAIDADGRIAMPFVSEGMKRAWASGDSAPQSAAF